MAGTKRILTVSTSAAEYHDSGHRTGLWLGELTHFYDEVTQAGHEVVVASIDGGMIPLDPVSLMPPVINQGGTKKRYADRAFMDLLSDTPSIHDIDASDVDAIYLAGGHGTMYDFTRQALADLVSDVWAQDKVVSAVCHGPVGLLQARTKAGAHLVAGRKVTGFSWAEEKVAGRADHVPFDLSKELKKRGATYEKARRPMGKNVVVDGRLITGQNPTSAAPVAKAVLKKLRDLDKRR